MSIFILFSSCAEKEVINIEELIVGDWDVVAYAKYQQGETATLIEGKPYWHLRRYSQGISIEKDGYYYRYGSIDEVNKTRYNVKGDWEITENLDYMTFSVPNFQSQEPYQIQAEIIDLDNKNLWIKYGEGEYMFEYKYQKD